MKIRNLILIALFAAMMAISAKIQIPMVPVPITLQLMFSVLAGALLGPRLGALSQVLYIAIGLLGAPVFAGSDGGFGYVLRPSFGYLAGFILCAFVSGLLMERIKKMAFVKLLLVALAGALSVYLIGLPYLYFMLHNTSNAIPVEKLMVTYFLAFLPGDLLKCVIAAILTVKLRPLVLKKNPA